MLQFFELKVITFQYLQKDDVNDVFVIVGEVLIVEIRIVTLTRSGPMLSVFAFLFEQFLERLTIWYDPLDQIVEAQLRFYHECRISRECGALVARRLAG